MTLAMKLRILRKRRGLKLREVSASVGLTVAYISDLERGRTNPSIDTLFNFARFYGLRPVDLVIGTDEWGTPSRGGG